MAIKELLNPIGNNVVTWIFPTDNQWGIPVLPLNMAGKWPETPINIWGAKARNKSLTGTVFHYTDDYRFNGHWKNPSKLIDTSITLVGEVNYTITLQTPKAIAIELIFKKRWLSRYWAEAGIRILVDVNVPTEFQDIALLGVPKGWDAYCTHGYSDGIAATYEEFDMACRHAGTSDIFFTVYGGGRKVKEECQKMGWCHVIEESDRARGRFKDDFNVSTYLKTENKASLTQSVGI